MDQYTVVIADSSEDFRQALQSLLEPFCRVICCENGMEAAVKLSGQHPQVLVLDLMLPMLDGLTLLRLMEAAGYRPGILATSSYISPYILKTAEELGIKYLLEKPCDLKKTAELIWKLLQDQMGEASSDRYGQISGLLLQLGFSAKLRGYAYLREAVLMCGDNPGCSIFKAVYPGVAAAFGVTAEDVEHSIRSAAMDAWEHRPAGLWEFYFGDASEGGLVRPANAAMIMGLAKSLGELKKTAKAN